MSDTEPALIQLSQKIGAEVLGTFVLVFFGAGTAIVSGGDYVATGLAFGFAIIVMVYAVGHISGGHFNPAVSVSAALSGRIAWSQVLFYVGAQLAGALLGGLALFVLLQGVDNFEASGNMGQNSFGNDGSGYAVWAAFLLELLATAIFVYVILAATDLRNPNPTAAPAVIGLALTFIHFATIGLTGTSVNPARSIGVGVFAGSDAVIQLWLFILAPLVGAAVAGLTYPLVFGRDREPVAGSGLNFSRPARPAASHGPWDPNAQYQQPQQGWDPNAQQQWGQTGAQQWQDPAQPWGQQGVAQQWGAGQPGAQQPQPTEYPGWRWDAATQQWVPDQQWQQPGAPGAHLPGAQTPGAQTPGADADEESRTQIRPPDAPA